MPFPADSRYEGCDRAAGVLTSLVGFVPGSMTWTTIHIPSGGLSTKARNGRMGTLWSLWASTDAVGHSPRPFSPKGQNRRLANRIPRGCGFFLRMFQHFCKSPVSKRGGLSGGNETPQHLGLSHCRGERSLSFLRGPARGGVRRTGTQGPPEN